MIHLAEFAPQAFLYNAQMLKVPKLETFGNFKLENFDETNTGNAKRAIQKLKDLSRIVAAGVAPFPLDRVGDEMQHLISLYFDLWKYHEVLRPSLYSMLRKNLQLLDDAVQKSPITLVNRADMVFRDEKDKPRILPDVPGSAYKGQEMSGKTIAGMVYWVHDDNDNSLRHYGSGYRIILGACRPKDGAQADLTASIIYHELAHKVLEAVDHAYGATACRELADKTNSPYTPMKNADSYGCLLQSLAGEHKWHPPAPKREKPKDDF